LQRITDIGILNKKPKTIALGAPSHNTRSQTQVQTITQEAILACIVTYSNITNRHITARNASCRKFPIEMLNAVLNMNTGKLMEMKHLLVNPKYKDLWGKSYTKELGRLAKVSLESPAPTPSYLSNAMRSHLNESRMKHMDRYALIIAPKKMTQITHNSQWEEIISIIQATVARQLLTW
jgi:hypothetical protein